MTRRALQPTRNDLRKWEKLIREVRAVARDPYGPVTRDLARAAGAAHCAVAPGWASLEACADLCRMADGFYSVPVDERATVVAAMTARANQVEHGLATWDQPAPRRRRADIDGED